MSDEKHELTKEELHDRKMWEMSQAKPDKTVLALIKENEELRKQTGWSYYRYPWRPTRTHEILDEKKEFRGHWFQVRNKVSEMYPTPTEWSWGMSWAYWGWMMHAMIHNEAIIERNRLWNLYYDSMINSASSSYDFLCKDMQKRQEAEIQKRELVRKYIGESNETIADATIDAYLRKMSPEQAAHQLTRCLGADPLGRSSKGFGA